MKLWSLGNARPVHKLLGHTDTVMGIGWRSVVTQGKMTHQLVSWGKDRCLRFWRIDPTLQQLCAPRAKLKGDALEDIVKPSNDETDKGTTKDAVVATSSEKESASLEARQRPGSEGECVAVYGASTSQNFNHPR